MHNIYIRTLKDLTKQWTKLPFVATDDAIFNILEAWPPKWHTPNLTEIKKSVAQRKKDETKLHIAQLVEKRRKEVVAAEVREVRDAAQTTLEQEHATLAIAAMQEATVKAREGQLSPSHG